MQQLPISHTPVHQPDFQHHEIHIRLPTISDLPILEEEENDVMMMAFYLFGDYHDMRRSKKEELIKSLQRLARNCATKYEKMNKSKQNQKKKRNNPSSAAKEETIEGITTTQPKPFPMEQVVSSTYITDHHTHERLEVMNLTNEDYRTGMKVVIPIHSELSLEYLVVVNPPSIVSLTTYPKTFYTVGCPILPNVITQHASDYECLWYVETSPGSNEYSYHSNQRLFTPTTESVGCKLKLFCTAFRFEKDDATLSTTFLRRGRSFPFYLTGEIIPIPRPDQLLSRLNQIRTDYYAKEKFPFHEKEENKESSNYDLRILSYNILSDGYCSREFSITTLYGYCQRNYLDIEYRIQRIALELIHSQADIITLQECDQKVYDEYLFPFLQLSGDYHGFFTKKFSSVREGCAIFLKSSQLRTIQCIHLPMKEYFQQSKEFQPFYQLRPDLKRVVGERLGTIAQIVITQDLKDPSQIVIIVNTHLFYHPLAAYIRLLQLHIIVQRVEFIIQMIHESERSEESIDLKELLAMEEQEILEGIKKGQPSSSSAWIEELRKESTMIHPDTEAMIELDLKKRIQQLSLSTTSSPFKGKDNHHRYTVSIILAGDLNTTPGIVGLDYLEKGQERIDLAKLQNAWSRICQFYFDGVETADESEETVKALDNNSLDEQKKDERQQSEKEIEFEKDESYGPLSPDVFKHSFQLENTTKSVQYTNYTKGFQDLLDYIFISKDTLEVVDSAPMPTSTDLQEEVAIPSSVFPSDHLSIGIDVKYKQKK